MISYAALGWARGFLYLLVDLVGFLLSIGVALLAFGGTAKSFGGDTPESTLSRIIGFIVVFTIVDILYHALTRPLLRKIPKTISKSSINRSFGAMLGVINGLIFCTVALLLLTAIPVGISRTTVEASTIGASLLDIGSDAEQKLASIIPNDIGKQFYS